MIIAVPAFGQAFSNQGTVKVITDKKHYSVNKDEHKMDKPMKIEKAVFGAGCFWAVEETFRRLPGVLSTMVGYSGGSVANPSYEHVCQGDTGHAEVVEIEYDPAKIKYRDLLKVFFENHDPTTLNRQGPDIGYQYRSVIFYENPEQEKEAIAAKEQVQADNPGRAIVTAIEPAKPFYKAEEYHQQYLKKRGLTDCH